MAIMAAMADHMPAFHQLLSTAQPGDIDQLTRKLPGFYRYAKILESLATGIQSGAIPVPGRKEAPRQTKPVTDHRQRAAAMDLRMRQLAEEGVPRSAIIDAHDRICRRSRQNLERDHRRTARRPLSTSIPVSTPTPF